MKSSLFFATVAFVALVTFVRADDQAGITRVPVVFSGGHDTDERDHGRPVYLVAGALGVPSDVFREAFSHVHPAKPDSGAHESGHPAPGPSQGDESHNKEVLMGALGKYGINNERIDAVSNYYRYVRSRGEMWPTKPATAVALVKNGQVISYEVTDGGSGYTTPPTLTVAGVTSSPAKVELATNPVFEKNGAISAIKVAN